MRNPLLDTEETNANDNQGQASLWYQYGISAPAQILAYAGIGATAGFCWDINNIDGKLDYDWTIHGAEVAAGLAILRLAIMGIWCMYLNCKENKSSLSSPSVLPQDSTSAKAYDYYRNHHLSTSVIAFWGAAAGFVSFVVGAFNDEKNAALYAVDGAMVGLVLGVLMAFAYRKEHSSATGEQLGFSNIKYKSTPLYPLGGLAHCVPG
jgi:hypothetical protein